MTAHQMWDLETLACVYFGQDWDIVVDSPRDAVEMFVQNRGTAVSTNAIKQISDAVDTHDECGLENLWRIEFGSAFRVPPTGMTYRQWFEHLRDLLLEATPVEP